MDEDTSRSPIIRSIPAAHKRRADFSDERFREHHVFSTLLQEWPLGFRERIEPLLQAALGQLNGWFASLPTEWLHLEADETLPVQLDQKLVSETLARAFTEPAAFWNRL